MRHETSKTFCTCVGPLNSGNGRVSGQAGGRDFAEGAAGSAVTPLTRPVAEASGLLLISLEAAAGEPLPNDAQVPCWTENSVGKVCLLLT